MCFLRPVAQLSPRTKQAQPEGNFQDHARDQENDDAGDQADKVAAQSAGQENEQADEMGSSAHRRSARRGCGERLKVSRLASLSRERPGLFASLGIRYEGFAD